MEINEKLKEMKNFQELNKPTSMGQIVSKIKKNLGDFNIDLLKILEDHDKTKTGFYFKINFIFFIH